MQLNPGTSVHGWRPALSEDGTGCARVRGGFRSPPRDRSKLLFCSEPPRTHDDRDFVVATVPLNILSLLTGDRGKLKLQQY